MGGISPDAPPLRGLPDKMEADNCNKHLKVPGVTLVSVLLMVATTIARGQESGRCGFDTGTALPPAVSPRSLAGLYQLEWHPVTNSWQRGVRRERLWLWLTSPSDTSVEGRGVRPAPGDTLVYPLFGATLPDKASPTAGDSLRRVTDPIFPPVLLFARWPRDTIRTRGSSLVLLFGTVTDRQPNVMSLDGPGVGVWLDRVRPDGIAGVYNRWGIVLTDSGFLCARRIR